MSLIAIRIPDPVYPKADPDNPCPCTERPMELLFKTCLLFPLANPGDRVEVGQIVAEFECEKKTAQIPAPETGILSRWCFEEGDTFDPEEIVGYVEADHG